VAARLKAVHVNGERKELRDQLQQGRLSLAQALAQDGEAARGMRVATVVRALPGIGAATAARLMREAGIDAARRVVRSPRGRRRACWPPWRSWTRSWPLVAIGIMILASERDAPRSSRRGGAARPAALARPQPGSMTRTVRVPPALSGTGAVTWVRRLTRRPSGGRRS
jgi:hypothetical protein